MRGYSDIWIFRYSDFQIFGFSDVQMNKTRRSDTVEE